jgi:hypothetical protein
MLCLVAALLQVGAGFVLALGFGLVGFTTYQKLGNASCMHSGKINHDCVNC